MSTQQHATATFTLDAWDEHTYDERPGAKLSRARVIKTFSGDLEGTSSTEILTATADGQAARAYVGLERIEGRLHGRAGSFVLHHTAIDSPATQTAAWTILAESGTGDLNGIQGRGQITIDASGGHTFTLDYTLP